MNFRKLASWQDAENIIPVGGKCFLDPRGERWVEHREVGKWWGPPGHGCLFSPDAEVYGATPYEATEKEVPISAAEAAARMVDGLPVEGTPCGWQWQNLRMAKGKMYVEFQGRDGSWNLMSWEPDCDIRFRIPAAQPEEDIYQIAVPKGTDMPPRFTIFPNEAGYVVISDNPKGITAHVVKQEVKE